MPRYTVYFMRADMTWEGIEAENEDDAIRAVGIPKKFDANEPHSFLAVEEDGFDELKVAFVNVTKKKEE